MPTAVAARIAIALAHVGTTECIRDSGTHTVLFICRMLKCKPTACSDVSALNYETAACYMSHSSSMHNEAHRNN